MKIPCPVCRAVLPDRTTCTFCNDPKRGQVEVFGATVGRMLISDQLVEEEGLELQGYTDSRGYLTIGIGRLIDSRVPGSGLTREEALYLLVNDIVKCRAQLDRALPFWRHLDDARQRVLISMCFNLGINGLLKFKNTLTACRLGQYAATANGMRSSLWYRQVGARAERLALMMERGSDVAMAEAREIHARRERS